MNQLTLLAFESLQRPVARLQLRGSGRHGRRPSTEEETNLSTSVNSLQNGWQYANMI